MTELPETPMIHGEKTWLRAMENRDLNAFSRGRNDLNVGYEASFYFPESQKNLERWIENLMSDGHGKNGFYFTICRLGTDDVVGFVWLWHLNYKDSNAEISIFLSKPELKGQGLGTDALNAVLDFGFINLPLERIYLKVRAENEAAVRSYEKAGMTVEGTLRKSTRYQGKLVDDLLFAILREEWENLGRRKSEINS